MLKVGYDSKRAFHNTTGLGNYSRMLIEAMYTKVHPYLFTPFGATSLYAPPPGATVVSPRSSRLLWRTWRQSFQAHKLQLDIYHGLSHQLPYGLTKTGIQKVVTMHDCIFKRYPHSFSWVDRLIYDRKWRHALKVADHIIAISQATADDLISFYNASAAKITVIPLCVGEVFHKDYSPNQIRKLKKKYDLDSYFLFVGAHHPRKNLPFVLSAFRQIKKENIPPLLIVGSPTKRSQRRIVEWGLERKVKWLSGLTQKELAMLYHGAIALIYPSLYEGFGLPILEAMKCGCPVITSNVSSMPEVGGEAAIYIDPNHTNELIDAMRSIAIDRTLRQSLTDAGLARAKAFSKTVHQSLVMQVYQSLTTPYIGPGREAYER